MNYYKAVVNMGHFGCGNKVAVDVYIKANGIIQAMAKAKAIPAIKHGNTVLKLNAITKEEYLQGKSQNLYYDIMSKRS